MTTTPASGNQPWAPEKGGTGRGHAWGVRAAEVVAWPVRTWGKVGAHFRNQRASCRYSSWLFLSHVQSALNVSPTRLLAPTRRDRETNRTRLRPARMPSAKGTVGVHIAGCCEILRNYLG